MNNPLIGILGVCLAAVAFLAVLWLVPLMARLRRRLAKAGINLDETEDEARALGQGEVGPELIAVIAAAVAAVSGLGVNEFRVVGINRVDGSASFNTPIWGHIDRLVPRSNAR
jgi:hypothetical protein